MKETEGACPVKKRKRILAGSIGIECDMPLRRRGDSPKERAAKARATSAAQKRMNQLNSMMELELRLAANFPTAGSGLVVVLTYDDEHLPKTRKQAQRRFAYFLKKLRAEREAAGLPAPRVIYAPEVLTSKSGRWHHHIVIDNTGDDLAMIRRCWGYGSGIACEKLRVDDEKNHETLARYMSKELREAQEYECRPGLHGWGCTRNCLKPEVDVVLVDEDERLDPPRGATLLLHETRRTEFSGYEIIKYRLGSAAFRRPPRAKRRRR